MVSELSKLLEIDDKQLKSEYVKACRERIKQADAKLKDTTKGELFTEEEAKAYETKMSQCSTMLDEMDRKLKEMDRKLEDVRRAKKELVSELSKLLEIDDTQLESEYIKACRERIKQAEAKLKDMSTRELLTVEEVGEYEIKISQCRATLKLAEERINKVKELVDKARFYYENKEYYDTVKYYRDAVKSGHVMKPGDLKNFDDAFKKVNDDIQQKKGIFEVQSRQGRNFTRDINELNEKSKNLVDWRFDVIRH